MWTFGLDESGSAEGTLVDAEVRGYSGFLVGGPLAPVPAHALEEAMEAAFAHSEAIHGLPFRRRHASELSEGTCERVVGELSTHLARVGGFWLFVLDERESTSDDVTALLRYVRTLAAAIDGAGRLASLFDGPTLSLRIAQRSVPMNAELATLARERGAALETVCAPEETRYRAVVESEARQVLESLARETSGWLRGPCALEDVQIETASRPRASSAIHAADFGCNGLFRALSHARNPKTRATPLALDRFIPGPAPVVVLQRDTIGRVRRLQRALFSDPPDVLSAAEAVALPTASSVRDREFQAHLSALMARAQGAAVDRLANSTRLQAGVESFARALAFRGQSVLAARSGHYEAVWEALETGWSGGGSLAARVREQVTDRGVRATLSKVVVECANHRGDVGSALRWADFHRAEYAGRRSLRALADALYVETLATVTVQNTLPTPAPQLADTRAALTHRTELLHALASEARELTDLASALTDHALPVAEGWSSTDRDLHGALGFEPLQPRPDAELGMALGTIARSWAFLGRLDEALRAALEARRHFLDSEMDLRFNAHVIGRILAERARVGHRTLGDEPAALVHALRLAGVSLDGKAQIDASSVRARPAERFGLDLALRVLLFAPEYGTRAQEWAKRLSNAAGEQLRTQLASELRSHPSELVARHAGELLERHVGRDAAKPWYDFALSLADEQATDSTLARIGAFTRALAETPGFVPDGEEGSILSPTFEYR